VQLDLVHNQLNGRIPECIGSLDLLSLLDIGEDKFSGELPIGICDLVKLDTLGIHTTLIEGSIPACIGSLTKLKVLALTNNIMSGRVPESLGQLILLQELYFGDSLNGVGDNSNSNAFDGPLPSSMINLVLLEKLNLNVATLIGPLPDFSLLTRLTECFFMPSELCINPSFVPVNSECDFSLLPECEMISDCAILADWIPQLFDSYKCCQEDGVTCEEDYIVVLDLSSARTETKISGFIPVSIGEFKELKELYLQDNFIGGNLPLSMSNISSLQIVNISNNFLSGELPFIPAFELYGIESNIYLSLPIDLSTSIEMPIETTAQLSQTIVYGKKDTANVTLIIGLSAIAILVIVLITAVVMILIRRKQGKESEIELRLLPKYSSPNKQIRLIRMVASGGFVVVWKARYKGQTVAIKLIRMDKYEGKEYDRTRNVKIFTMVVEEASIMELMVHKRIVKYIMFEFESVGIVLEYLPLGSLYDYIQKSKEGIPWTDRYQMMLDICEGMEFLHSNVYADGLTKNVLFHQDLKSGNVLLCMEGSPDTLRGKISDFGLSCKFYLRLTLNFSLERQSYKQECP
jgi:hypothetical protein